VPRLQRGQTIRRAYLGVSTSQAAGGRGATVQTITPGGPAARVGLHAADPITGGGDVITSVDGKAISSPDDLSSEIGAHKPGDKVTIGVLRNGTGRTIRVTLDDRPATAPASSQSP
jgi:S1-C subfamily serine protease